METLFGPLAGFECRRALGRGWLILIRTLAALAILSVTLIVLWYGWICVQANALYRPYPEFRTGLAIIEGLTLTIALVLSPAILAGSLAGEKERGALGLILATRVTPREVVTGLFAGKLTQIFSILLVGMPSVVALATLTGSSWQVTGTLLLVPAAVGFGIGGLATAVSAVSRRGRDALMSVYLLMLLFLLIPMFVPVGSGFGPSQWLKPLNPYDSLGQLIWQEKFDKAVASVGLWTTLGLAGLSFASWRLAPSCLRELDGARLGKSRRRRTRIPALHDRPMVWKELYIERAGTLGGAGRWVGALLALALVVGSLSLAGVILWNHYQGSDNSSANWALLMLRSGIVDTAIILAWLIEWAVGLRAAVTIASERERGTWDAILTSPLEAAEIVWAKLCGSLFALRWLIAAAIVAWTVTVAAEAMPVSEYLGLVARTLVISAFMAAVGIRTSLTSTTATRAMAVTIGLWLGALVAFSIASAILSAFAWLIFYFGLVILSDSSTLNPNLLLKYQPIMDFVHQVIGLLPYLIATLILVGVTRYHFDRLAGRGVGFEFVPRPKRGSPPKTATTSSQVPPSELCPEPVGHEAPLHRSIGSLGTQPNEER